MDVTVNGDLLEDRAFSAGVMFSTVVPPGPTTVEIRHRAEPRELVGVHTFDASPITFSDMELYPWTKLFPKYVVIGQGHPGAYRSDLVVVDWGPPAAGHVRLIVMSGADDPISVRTTALDGNLQPDPTVPYGDLIVEHLAPATHATIEIPLPPPGVFAGLQISSETTPSTTTVIMLSLLGFPSGETSVSMYGGTVSILTVHAGLITSELASYGFTCRDDRFTGNPECGPRPSRRTSATRMQAIATPGRPGTLLPLR